MTNYKRVYSSHMALRVPDWFHEYIHNAASHEGIGASAYVRRCILDDLYKSAAIDEIPWQYKALKILGDTRLEIKRFLKERVPRNEQEAFRALMVAYDNIIDAIEEAEGEKYEDINKIIRSGKFIQRKGEKNVA